MNKKDLAKKIIAGSMLAPAILLAGCNGDKDQKQVKEYQIEMSDVERGTGINANDIVLTVTYTDGTTGTIRLTDDMIKSYDTSTVGVSNVTILVNGVEQTFDFNVTTNDEDVAVLNAKFEKFLSDYKSASSASVSAKYSLKYRFGTYDEVEVTDQSIIDYKLDRNTLSSETKSQKMLYDAIVNSLVYSTMGKSAVTSQLSPTVHTAEPMAQFVDIIQKFSNTIDKSTVMTAVCDTINQLVKSGNLGVDSYTELNSKIADALCDLLYTSNHNLPDYYNMNLETGTRLPDIQFATSAEKADFKVKVLTALTKFTSEIETKRTFTLDNYKTLVNDLIDVIDTHIVDYEKGAYAVSTTFRYDAGELCNTTLEAIPTTSAPFYYMYFVDKTTGNMPIYKTTPKNYVNGAWVEALGDNPTVYTSDINGESRQYYKIPVTSDKFMTPDGAVWVFMYRPGERYYYSCLDSEQPNWQSTESRGYTSVYTSSKWISTGWSLTRNDEWKTMLQSSLVDDPAHALSTTIRWTFNQVVYEQSTLNGQYMNNIGVNKDGVELDYLTSTEYTQTKGLLDMFCDTLSAIEDVCTIDADFTLLDWYNALTDKYDTFMTAFKATVDEGYDYVGHSSAGMSVVDAFVGQLRSVIDGIYTSSAKEYFLSNDFANLVGSYTGMLPNDVCNSEMYGKVVTTALTILLDNGTEEDSHLDYHDYIDTLCDLMASNENYAVSAEDKQRLHDEYNTTHQAVNIVETIFGDVNSEDTPHNNYCRQLNKFINQLGLCDRDEMFDELKDLTVSMKAYVNSLEGTENFANADGKKLWILMSDIAIDMFTRPEIDGVKQSMTGIDFANNVKNSLSNRSSQISEWFVTFMYENGLVQDENNTKFNDIVARMNVIVEHVKAGEHKDAIEKMTTLVDLYGTQDHKTMWYSSLLTMCVFTDADVDYNELMKNVQLPEYINSVDYNKLVAKIRDGRTWTDMFTLDDITVETIQENDAITGETVTLNLKVNNDLMIAAIDGSVTVVFDIKF